MARPKDPEREQRRRADIMTTCLAQLAERGHRSVTLAKVAAAAGVSKGLVTYYFGTKDALLLATIAHYHAQQRALLDRVVSGPGSQRKRLETLVYAAFPSVESVTQEVRFQAEVWSFAKDRPEALDGVRASYKAFREACATLFDVPDDRYAAVHALVDGLSFQVAVQPDVPIAEVRQRALDGIVRLVGPLTG